MTGDLVPRLGVFPGSFNPPTAAHVEIALVARHRHGLDRIDFAISVSALGKHDVAVPRLEHRVEVLRTVAADYEGLGVVVTELQFVADIAATYDVVVMGADKWAQVNDATWYTSTTARDDAVHRLPTLALAPRPPYPIPDEHRLDVADDLLEVSSTGARAGRREWMTDAARRFDEATGAWSDPDRYRRHHL